MAWCPHRACPKIALASPTMAILDKIEVQIRSDGNILTKYNDPDKDLSCEAKTVTKLIKATLNAKFCFEISLLPGYSALHSRKGPA